MLKQYTEKFKDELRVLFRYLDAGVESDKLNMSQNPALTIWSISREMIVGEKDTPCPLEVYSTVDGDLKATYENNRHVSFQVRTELSNEEVDKINNSKGIIISNEKRFDDFRYGYIPEK